MPKVRKVLKWLDKNGFQFNPKRLATDGSNVFWLLDSDSDRVVEILEKTEQMIVLKWDDIVDYCVKLFEKNGLIVKLDVTGKKVERIEKAA